MTFARWKDAKNDKYTSWWGPVFVSIGVTFVLASLAASDLMTAPPSFGMAYNWWIVFVIGILVALIGVVMGAAARNKALAFARFALTGGLSVFLFGTRVTNAGRGHPAVISVGWIVLVLGLGLTAWGLVHAPMPPTGA